ncbi:type I-E CRISPR-associated protein Cas5/CasD [Embleya sp. NPDC059237]|uniref:type I-E CRISPR-associated protein Cas5/CasD n=1 Tax=Embleya sp. NPDC059237 TaxID=3346784 RepID=UPI0036A58356
MNTDHLVLLLRLAGPMQSWGDRSAFNRRETRPEPTKSGVVGLLAAAAGRRREADITDLTDLRLGVRVDQAGSLMRDYHTVSDYRGQPLPQAGVSAKGIQKPTSPAKYTHITQRFYLQDAVFVAGIEGPADLITTLGTAISNPAFPLALGRRSCVPTQPVNLGLRPTDLETALITEPWQIGDHARRRQARKGRPATVQLAATLDDPDGDDVAHDRPVSFDPLRRAFTSRRIRHDWLTVPSGFDNPDPDRSAGHDPFALLDW